LTALYAAIAQAMLADQPRLRRRLRACQGGPRGAGRGDSLAQIAADVQHSVRLRQERLTRLPRPTFAADLPVVQRRSEIAAAIAQHQVIVLCGETGSGKTTQLPKICLELGRGVGGWIGHTQPRRIAARAVAARLAEELRSPLGAAVGYKVRFAEHLCAHTHIKLMTDGILLAETQTDRYLNQYDTLIIDEAHERSLNIDFLLGYLKNLLPRRPDLKVIITSATIDPERFSRHFGQCPILMVSGRTYPVEVRYRPLVTQDDPDEEDPTILEAILRAVDELSAGAAPGDILIFLSGEREIRETAEALRRHQPAHTEILPLYARLAHEEQSRIFQPHRHRRIVLATNVAETSLTVPGIRYVIDPGLARISRYAPRTKVQRLRIEPVSQASANQRMGRCGRVAAGICIRLYAQEDFLARPAYTEPEILRTNLAAVILQMKAFGLGAIEEFPFLDRPEARQITDGYATLHELGAVDAKNNLTPLGGRLARLPIDPRIARMIIAGEQEGVLPEMLIIAAALSVPDPRERPLDKQPAADEAHRKFRESSSDFLGFLKLWDGYHEAARHLSLGKLRKWCQEHFLSFVRMREWHDIQRQLQEIIQEEPADRRPGRNS